MPVSAANRPEFDPPLLTVICTTYNHASYIGQALEGFIRQKTNFEFIVLVGDDASTDGTSELVQQYTEKYPGKITAVLRDRNLGPGDNALDLYRRVSSKYVAICEGDDYWTDEGKLQKQVDFLERHPDYAICFHPVAVLNELDEEDGSHFPAAKTRFYKLSLTLRDLLKHNFIQTNSVVYRWRFSPNASELANFVSDELQPGDYVLHLLHAEKGQIQCLDEVMAVYRRHMGGMWTGAMVRDEWFLKWGLSVLNFHVFKENYFHYPPQPQEMLNAAIKLITAALQAGNFALIERLALAHPRWYKKAVDALGVFFTIGQVCSGWRKELVLVLCRYTLLSKLTWGKTKRHYLQKRNIIKTYLRQLAILLSR